MLIILLIYLFLSRVFGVSLLLLPDVKVSFGLLDHANDNAPDNPNELSKPPAVLELMAVPSMPLAAWEEQLR